MKNCDSVNPATGHACTMGKGHCGPHVVGSPYRPAERWVTRCPKSKCVYHENSNSLQKTRWLECIHCGHIKPMPKRCVRPKIMVEYLRNLKKANVAIAVNYRYWHEAADQAAWTVKWTDHGQHESVMTTCETLAFLRGALVAAVNLAGA